MTDVAQKKKRGWARHNELRQLDEAAKAEILLGLIACLGRDPTMADYLASEQIASLTVHARRLERRGQFDRAAAIRDQITRATRAFGIVKPQPPTPAPKKDIRELLRERGHTVTP